MPELRDGKEKYLTKETHLGTESTKWEPSTLYEKYSSLRMHRNLNENSKEGVSSFGGSIEEDIVEAVNEYRGLHGAPKLSLSQSLSKMAEETASRFARGFDLDPSPTFGIIWTIIKSSLLTLGKSLAVEWYSGADHYEFGKEPQSRTTRSDDVTQMLWKTTREMGLSFLRSSDEQYYLVIAYFDPKGNWPGMFSTQVQPLCQNEIQEYPKQSGKVPSSVNDSTDSIRDTIEHQLSMKGNTDFRWSLLKNPIHASVEIGNNKLSSSPESIYPNVSSQSLESNKMLPADSLSFTKGIIEALNVYRNKRGALSLSLNKDLIIEALKWATNLAHLCKLSADDNCRYFYVINRKPLRKITTKILPSKIIDSWFSLSKGKLHEGNYSKSDLIGNVNLALEKDIKHLGSAIVYSADEMAFVVVYFN